MQFSLPIAEEARGHDTPCWMWQGFLDKRREYGLIVSGSSFVAAYRYTYVMAKGEPPDGHVIHHKCKVRACVNPDHLEALTRAEHGKLHSDLRTKCKNGHDLTHLKNGQRCCLICKAEHNRQYKVRMKAERLANRMARKKATHCKQGHEFTEENTKYDTHGYRHCRICGNKYALEYYHLKKTRLATFGATSSAASPWIASALSDPQRQK